MLNVDNVAVYLLERALIDISSIIDSDLTIRSVARRNRNLTIQGPAGTGLFLKQAEDAGEAGGGTLGREAAFHRFSADEPAVAEVSQLIPRLVSGGGDETVLVFELISDAVSLRSQLDAPGSHGSFVAAARKLGQALGTVHRTLRLTDWGMDPRLAWLSRSLPWSMTLHRPTTSLLATLCPATYETLRILQTQEAFTDQLESLSGQWQTRCVIHGDIRFDNILVRSAGADQEPCVIALWLTDWEMIQFGDPAWDLAGALQDFLVFWVSTMPLSEDLTTEQTISEARVPLSGLRSAARAMWFGYRKEAGLGAGEADELLRRAVAFSAGRLIQSAFEAAHGAHRLPGRSVILLQISANLLAEPERGQAELYGIPVGSLGL